ncbi:MAG: hypothetical protein R3A13_10865 [Bdellovibrionota bacterium]
MQPEGSNRIRNVLAGLTLGISASVGLNTAFFPARSALAEGTAVEVKAGNLELSTKQRKDLISAVKTLAEIGLSTEAFQLLGILERTDVRGVFAKDNEKLKQFVERKLIQVIGTDISEFSKKSKSSRIKSNLQDFTASLIEGVELLPPAGQREVLRILAQIDTASKEFLDLKQELKSKGVPILFRDSVAARILKINSQDFSSHISSNASNEGSRYFSPGQSVNSASYRDQNDNTLSIQSTVLNKSEISTLLTKALMATILFEGLTSQNWNLPTVDQLSFVLLGADESPTVSTDANTEKGIRFFRIDASNKGSSRLQANMLLTDLLGRALQAEKYQHIPFFIKVGLMDLVSREITQFNAGAVAEIKRSVSPSTDKGVNMNETEGFKTLVFSGSTAELNEEEAKAIASPELTLSRLLDNNELSKAGLGRLAAVRYVQYLFERGLLVDFIAQLQATNPADKLKILESLSGKGVAEIQANFTAWFTSRSVSEEPLVIEGVIQGLATWETGTNLKNGRSNSFEDQTKQLREANDYLKRERAAYLGVDLPLVISPLLCEAARLHDRYLEMRTESGSSHYQSTKSENFTLLGAYGGQTASIYGGTVQHAVETFLGTVYHRFSLVDPRISAIGSYSGYATLTPVLFDMHDTYGSRIERKVLCYPANEAKNIPIQFGSTSRLEVVESPDPAPGARGFPITVDFRGSLPKNVKIRLYEVSSNGTEKELEGVFLTPETDPHKILKNQAALVPLKELKRHTKHYYLVEGDDFETIRVDFTTAK